MPMQPILQSSCARATSWAEARFRIDAPIAGRRGARVIALDDDAATLIRGLAREQWNGARFFTLIGGQPCAISATDRDSDMRLHRITGGPARLVEELAEADVAVMVAAGSGSPAAAAAVGRDCARKGITTVGVVLDERSDLADTISALRPHTRVLLVSHDAQDVAEVLRAIRA